MAGRGLPSDRLIGLRFGEHDYEAAMREHHGGLHAGRRNLRILVALLLGAMALLALVGRGGMAMGLAFHLILVLVILAVVEVVYRWVGRRRSPDPG